MDLVELSVSNIAEKVKNKEPLTSEEFQFLVKRTDWISMQRRVVWRLNEPRCSCGSCYDSWLKFGEKLYEGMPEQFQEIKHEALTHMRTKQEGIKERKGLPAIYY